MQTGTNTQKQHSSSNIPGMVILQLIRYFSGDNGQELLMNIYTTAIDGLAAVGPVVSSLM